MRLNILDGFDYIPNIGDNKKLKKEEQVVFHMKFLTVKEYLELLSDGPLDKAKEWLAYCTGIDNLIVNGKEATPESLLKKSGAASLISSALEVYGEKQEITILK